MDLSEADHFKVRVHLIDFAIGRVKKWGIYLPIGLVMIYARYVRTGELSTEMFLYLSVAVVAMNIIGIALVYRGDSVVYAHVLDDKLVVDFERGQRTFDLSKFRNVDVIAGPRSFYIRFRCGSKWIRFFASPSDYGILSRRMRVFAR